MTWQEGLCIVCGKGKTLPHQEWCERVGQQNAQSCTPGRTLGDEGCLLAVCLTHFPHMPGRRRDVGGVWVAA